MEKEKAKKAAELAEKELQEEEEQKQRDLIKKAIKQTLEKIKEKEKQRTKLNKEIKSLKQDIDNIREGRLDLIAERQEKDDDARKTSIIEVIKEIHHHHYNRWYEPYRIIWKYESDYCTGDYSYSDCFTFSNTPQLEDTSAVTNSLAKDSYAGTYKLDNGECVTLS